LFDPLLRDALCDAAAASLTKQKSNRRVT